MRWSSYYTISLYCLVIMLLAQVDWIIEHRWTCVLAGIVTGVTVAEVSDRLIERGQGKSDHPRKRV